MYSTLKKNSKITLVALIVSIVIYYVMWHYIPTESISKIKTTELGYALLASLAVYIVRSVRIKALYPHIQWSAIYLAVATQTFLLRVLPMRLGELGLAVLLQKRGAVPIGQGMVLLLWLRLSEICVLLIACLLAWFYMHQQISWTLVLYSIIAIIMCDLALPGIQWMCRQIKQWLIVYPHVNQNRYGRALIHVCTSIEQAHGLSHRTWMTLMFYSALIMFLQCALFLYIIRACGGDIAWPALVIASSCAHVAGAIPAPTIGNVGTHESAWVLGFTWMGLPFSIATLSALVSQGFTLACAGLWFAICSLFIAMYSPSRHID